MINKKFSLWKYALHTFIYGIFLSVITFLMLIFVYNMVLTPIKINRLVMNETKAIEIIEETLRNVSESREYERGIYDCSEYSRQLVESLNEKGISAYCVVGLVEVEGKNYGHTWVEILIEDKKIILESTSGIMIFNGTERYKPIQKGVCL